MTQNTITIVTPINRNDLEALDHLLGDIGHAVEKNQYIRFVEIASLHMAAFVVAAQDSRFAPILIFESVRRSPIRRPSNLISPVHPKGAASTVPAPMTGAQADRTSSNRLDRQARSADAAPTTRAGN